MHVEYSRCILASFPDPLSILTETLCDIIILTELCTREPLPVYTVTELTSDQQTIDMELNLCQKYNFS